MFCRKIIFVVLLCGLIFPASIALADGDANSNVMEFNTLCWKEKDCMDARKPFSQDPSEAELKKGWIEKGGNCKGGWGLCLPVGKTKTSISFAGKAEFLHIGDYILTIYKYALTIASIVAVVMIIIAGMQWITSGGNADAISKAKTRLTGAFVGLFILYSSYFILNTINPALVNLRLPQTYMIKPRTMMPTFCSSAPSTTKFALGADYTDQTKKLDKPSGKYNLEPYKKYFGPAAKEEDKKQFYCGKRFFLDGGGDSTCLGDYCNKVGNDSHVCAFADEGYKAKYPQQTYICIKALISGSISYSQGLVPNCWPDKQGWNYPEITDEGEQELWIVCDSRQTKEVSTNGYTQNRVDGQEFAIQAKAEDINEAIKWCGGKDKTWGFAIKFEMDEACDPTDEAHFVSIVNNMTKDLGLHSISPFTGEYNLFEYLGVGESSGVVKKNFKKGDFIPVDSILKGMSGIIVDARVIKDVD